MLLYFDILPLELKYILIRKLPPIYLLGPKYMQCQSYVFNIFELSSFKQCDSEQFWKYCHESLSNSIPHNTTCKESYTTYIINSILSIKTNTYPSAQHGHDKVLEYVFNQFHGVSFEFDVLLIIASRNTHIQCMKIIDAQCKLDKNAYDSALYRMLYENLMFCDTISARLNETTDFLLNKGASFPHFECGNFTLRLGRMDFSHDVVSERFIDFLIKYCPEFNNENFLKYLTLNYSRNAQLLIKYFIKKTGTQITSDVFSHVLKYGSHNMIKSILELDYYPSRQDMQLAKQHNAEHVIVDFYASKSLKRKRTSS